MNATTPDDAQPRPAADARWPAVSVVMPVRDEERHLAESVAGVLAQQYPGELEVVVAVAPSRDRTDEIAAQLAATDPRIRIVANPAGRTPAGLNAAIAAARHDVIVRVDGHGVLCEGYIRTAVEALEKSGAANVGGLMLAEGVTPFEQAVARAYMSPFGLGGAKFHQGGTAGPADTVYLGVFRRDVFERLGGYDEHFVRAQDWELNYRIRAAGETIWFVPELTVSYRPRPNLRALARQFFKTGQWRREVVRRYPDTASVRYLAAPVVTVAVLAGAVGAIVAGAAGASWWFVPAVVPVGYLLGVTVVGLMIGRSLRARARAWLPAVLATMHLSWGTGFILGSREADRAASSSTAQQVKERPTT